MIRRAVRVLLGVAAFSAGLIATVAAPSCGIIDPCRCPSIGPLGETQHTAWDVSAYDERGEDAPLPFGAFTPTVTTSATEVVIDYEHEGYAVRVTYDVR